MNRLFGSIILFSIVSAWLGNRMPQLAGAILEQAGDAVSLVLSLLGMLCLWSGLMRVAQATGLTKQLCKALSPITTRVFREIHPNGEAARAIAMNLSANLLGLGNAATPLGIQAMGALAKEQHAGKSATDNMVMLVVLNTASLQLIPTTTALLRMQAGSAAPMEILPAVWIGSGCSVVVGVVCAKLLAPFFRR